MGPTQAPGDDRAVARGRCRRRLEARPAVAQPEGHAAHHGADRARGSGLSFVDRSDRHHHRSEEHTSELQSLMRISYAVFCLKKQKSRNNTQVMTNYNIMLRIND